MRIHLVTQPDIAVSFSLLGTRSLERAPPLHNGSSVPFPRPNELLWNTISWSGCLERCGSLTLWVSERGARQLVTMQMSTPTAP